MSNPVLGLHHITALASDPQSNLDFYTGMMGLRLVKQTVNFDGPEIYHFYYGNADGSPGTLLTFFPYPGMVRGRTGGGQATEVAFSIPESAVNYWLERLKEFRLPYQGPYERLEETWIRFEDPDGLHIELIANATDTRSGWDNGDIPEEMSIRGLHSVTLTEEGYEKTAQLLKNQLGYTLKAQSGNRFRFGHADGLPGSTVDVICRPEGEHGRRGAGTVHHVAFATEDDDSIGIVRRKIAELGLNVTPVLDRKYFHSIYFREPGGVLFEVATKPPGFTVDEELEELGKSLQLPSQFETMRGALAERLAPIAVEKK